MARDPHTDLAGMKLEVGLRESNVAMADACLDYADSLMQKAMDALDGVPTPTDVVSRVIYAQAHAASAHALFAQVQVKLAVEAERAAAAHDRAHVTHAESEAGRAQVVERIRQEGLANIESALRAEGFDPRNIGFGFVIPPKPDESPNT